MLLLGSWFAWTMLNRKKVLSGWFAMFVLEHISLIDRKKK